MKYEIFFFKENVREFDAEALIGCILEDPNMQMIQEEDKVSLKYNNELIGLEYSLVFTKVSRVPDLARISPKYLDLDFYMEIDILLPMVKLNVMINTIEKICSRFDFLIYNVLFEGVTHFSKDIIQQSYDIVRRSYKEKFPNEYQSLEFINKSKLESYYKYILDAKDTNEYYNNKYLFLDAHFGKNNALNQVYLISELKLESSVIIPPNLDFLIITISENKYYYRYTEIMSLIGKYTKEFPGFVGNTRMIEEKSLKKINKVLSKMKLKPVLDKIDKISEERLIDF